MICPICYKENDNSECKPCTGIIRQPDLTVVDVLYRLLDIQAEKRVQNRLQS